MRDRLPAEERHKVVEEVSGPHLRVALSDRRVAVASGFAEHDPYETQFTESLQRRIGAPWPVHVDVNPNPRSAGEFQLWMARHFYFLLPEPFSIVVQVGLQDGTFAVFDVNQKCRSRDASGSNDECIFPGALELMGRIVCVETFAARLEFTREPVHLPADALAVEELDHRLAAEADRFGRRRHQSPGRGSIRSTMKAVTARGV